jgi:hypothetical protein
MSLRARVRAALVAVLLPALLAAAPDDTVYVTPSGEKYHRKECQYASMKSKPYTVEQAKRMGLDPCKRCAPPKQ